MVVQAAAAAVAEELPMGTVAGFDARYMPFVIVFSGCLLFAMGIIYLDRFLSREDGSWDVPAQPQRSKPHKADGKTTKKD